MTQRRREMERIEVVALCAQYDLKGLYGPYFEAAHPELRLLAPEEVADPAAIRHAFAFVPAPDAFDAYPNLELVSSAGAGVDGLLRTPSLRDGLAVSRLVVPEQAEMIAGFAIWHIVGFHREMARYRALQADGLWREVNRAAPSEMPVGLLGFGHIAATLGRALRALGHPVLAYGSRARVEDGIEVLSGPEGLARVLGEARAVVNLLPLTDATKGILNAARFAQMRGDAILVQLGRGGHLVEADLLAALEAGQLAHAALDVFETEPLPRDHPFWAHPKVTVTPHVAGEASSPALVRYVAEGILAFERGEAPRGLVDRARGY
jgi:glyoxylate/hydroxypyruvate reductase A